MFVLVFVKKIIFQQTNWDELNLETSTEKKTNEYQFTWTVFGKTELTWTSKKKEALNKPFFDIKKCVAGFDDVLECKKSRIQFVLDKETITRYTWFVSDFFRITSFKCRQLQGVFLSKSNCRDCSKLNEDTVGFKISYEAIKTLFRRTWKEKFDYLTKNDKQKNKQERSSIGNESFDIFKVIMPATKTFKSWGFATFPFLNLCRNFLLKFNDTPGQWYFHILKPCQ